MNKHIICDCGQCRWCVLQRIKVLEAKVNELMSPDISAIAHEIFKYSRLQAEMPDDTVEELEFDTVETSGSI